MVNTNTSDTANRAETRYAYLVAKEDTDATVWKTKTRLHPHRAARCYCHYRHSGRDPVPRLRTRPGAGPQGDLYEQSETDCPGDTAVRPGLRRDVPRQRQQIGDDTQFIRLE